MITAPVRFEKAKALTPFRSLMGGLLWAIAMLGLAPAAQAASYGYVFDDQTGSVSILDTEAQEVIVTVDVGLRIRWFSSRFFDGRHVWTVDGDPEKAEVIVLDPWTLKEIKRIPFGDGPSFSVELSPDYKYAIAAAAGSDEVVVIDTTSYEIVRRIPVGDFPCDLTLSKDGNLAFEPDRDQDTVSVIDWRQGRVLRTVPLAAGSKPHMLTLSADGRRLWVEESNASRVSILETSELETVAYIETGKMPATNEFSPDGRFTITTHMGDEIVMVFDTRTFGLIETVTVGKSPVNSVFRPDGRYVYVTNSKSGSVSVIDAETWRVIKTIDVGGAPFGIYLFDPTRGVMAGSR